MTDEDIDKDDHLICYNRKKMLQRMQENPNLKPPMIKYGKKDRKGAQAAARQGATVPVAVQSALRRSGHGIQAAMHGPGYQGRHPPLLPLQLGRTSPQGPLPPAVRPGEFRAEFCRRSPRLRQKRRGEPLHPDEETTLRALAARPFFGQAVNRFPAAQIEIANAKVGALGDFKRIP